MSYVLILGGNSEVGVATARKYAQYGYDIYLAAKNPEELGVNIEFLENNYGVKVKPVKFDSVEFYNHKKFYDSLSPKPFGVVCAIDYLGDQAQAENDFIEAKKIIDTNFTGCVSILDIVANDFEKRKEGFIAGISSVEGDRGRRNSYIYGSTKAAFTAYLSGLRSRLLVSDVHVSTIKTGVVKTSDLEGEDLPTFLTAKPDEIAHDIFKTQQKKRDIVYSKWTWRYAASVFNNIPEPVYKKMDT